VLAASEPARLESWTASTLGDGARSSTRTSTFVATRRRRNSARDWPDSSATTTRAAHTSRSNTIPPERCTGGREGESRDRPEPLQRRRSDEQRVHFRFAPAGGRLCPCGTVSRRAGHRPRKALAGLGEPIPLDLNFRVRWSLTWGPPQRKSAGRPENPSAEFGDTSLAVWKNGFLRCNRESVLAMSVGAAIF
jgi:hypothetical protein